jgi:hypothetical protein
MGLGLGIAVAKAASAAVGAGIGIVEGRGALRGAAEGMNWSANMPKGFAIAWQTGKIGLAGWVAFGGSEERGRALQEGKGFDSARMAKTRIEGYNMEYWGKVASANPEAQKKMLSDINYVMYGKEEKPTDENNREIFRNLVVAGIEAGVAYGLGKVGSKGVGTLLFGYTLGSDIQSIKNQQQGGEQSLSVPREHLYYYTGTEKEATGDVWRFEQDYDRFGYRTQTIGSFNQDFRGREVEEVQTHDVTETEVPATDEVT